MKKLLVLLLLVTLPLAVFAGRPATRTNNARLSALIAECRQYDGAEVVNLGWFGTSLVKGAIRISADCDPDTRAALQLLKGVKRFGVLDFSDCVQAARERISNKIARLLDRSEVLMEFKEDDTHMCIYGLLDEASGTIRDVFLYDAESCVLMYMNGAISMDAVGTLMAND